MPKFRNNPCRAAILVGLTLAVVFASSCAAPGPIRPSLALGADVSRWVERTMRRMSVEDKVAQMIACRYAGDFLPADADQATYLRELVAKHKVGGMIIFGGEAYETAHLNNRLQSLADIPLLIASDLERGTGTQITGATLFPTIMGLGAAGSETLAYEMGKSTALEGRALGIHITYAPVVDVNINPDNPIINTRAVGEDPGEVGRLAAAFIKGCQENGMLATAKHFPGHGDTALDSHILLPVIEASRERLEKVELAPYRMAIEAGVGAVMVAHLVVPALDPTPNLPATLSYAIQTKLLREQMGFKGLIVTDAMEMGGVTNAYSSTEAALKAIEAGVDMVLLPAEPVKTIEFLKEAARSGKLPSARLDASVRRILEAKARLGLDRQKLVDVEALPAKLGTKATLDQALRTFQAAATLVKNEGSVLPIAKSGKKVLVLSLSSDPGTYYAGRTFAAAVKARSPETRISYADSATGQEELDAAYLKAAAADVVVVGVFSSLSAWKGNVGLDLRHQALIQTLAALGKPTVVVSFGSPYLLRDFPNVSAYLCLYRNQPQTQETAARAIFGEIDVMGKLPVSLPGLFPAGYGVTLLRK